MAKSLAAMSVEALMKLRDDIGVTLNKRAKELQRQISALGDWGSSGGRKPGRKAASLKGRKVPPKYRGPTGELWAGRGARPRWMQEAIKGGAKPDDFLIAKGRKAKKPRKRKAA